MDKERQLIKDFKETFGTPHGQRVLAKLRTLSTYDYSRMPIDRNIDPYRVVADEAQRSVVCYIINKVEADLDKEEETTLTERLDNE